MGRRALTPAPLMAFACGVAWATLAAAQTAPSPSTLDASTVGEPSSTAAQPAPDDAGLAEIVVTAQRRAESAQRVPIAITTFDAAQLRALNIVDPLDIARQVPGLNFNKQFGASGPEIYIRGVGSRDVNINTTGAVGVYLDEVNLGVPISQALAVFDLERVEVLKGPQGTLYGKNTTGGALNFFSRKPDGTLNGSARLLYGRFDEINAEAALGFPITGGLSGRIAAFSNNRDGYARNLAKPDDDLVGKREEYGVRGHLRYEQDGLDLLLTARYVHADDDNPPGKFIGVANPNVPGLPSEALGLPPGGLVRGFFVPCGCRDGVNIIGLRDETTRVSDFTSADRGFDKIDNTGVSLNAQIDIPGHTLTSITAYESNSRRGLLDSGRTPIQVLTLDYDDNEGRQFSQELRLTSASEKPFKYIAGAYYSDTEIRSNDGFNLLLDRPVDVVGLGAFGIPDGTPIIGGLIERRIYKQKNPTWAVFAQATYALTDTLSLTGGLRYTEDRKRYNVEAFNLVVGNRPLATPETVIPPTRLRQNDEALSYRASIEYLPRRNTLFYASYNRGFKGGGFNGAATQPQELTQYDPETVDAFELGTKLELFDRRLRFNVSGFYYDYKNLQVFQIKGSDTPSGIAQTFENASDATVKGAEVELVARPIRQLSFNLGLSYIDAKYGTYVTNLDDNSGNRINNTPEFSANGIVNLSDRITDRFDGFIQIDYSYRSQIYFDSTERDLVSTGGGYWLVGGKAGITFNDGVTLSAFVRNLTNQRYITNVIDLSRTLNYLSYYRSEPRTFGVEASFRF